MKVRQAFDIPRRQAKPARAPAQSAPQPRAAHQAAPDHQLTCITTSSRLPEVRAYPPACLLRAVSAGCWARRPPALNSRCTGVRLNPHITHRTATLTLNRTACTGGSPNPLVSRLHSPGSAAAACGEGAQQARHRHRRHAPTWAWADWFFRRKPGVVLVVAVPPMAEMALRNNINIVSLVLSAPIVQRLTMHSLIVRLLRFLAAA